MSIKSHITDDDILAARQLLNVACHLEPRPQMLLSELVWLRLKAAREDWDVDAVDCIALIRGGTTDAEQYDGALSWLVEQTRNCNPICRGFARRIIDRIHERV